MQAISPHLSPPERDSNDSSAYRLLSSLALAWSSGRGTIANSSTRSWGEAEFVVSGPGFLYQWNDGDEPVGVAFLDYGEHQLPTLDGSYCLFIRADQNGLSLQTPTTKRPNSAGDDLCRKELENIISSAREFPNAVSQDPRGTLPIINAAQRMVALGQQSRSSESTSRSEAKVPVENRLVIELHEWLAGELENSVKLGDAASRFNKSPRQLIRILKRTTGCGFAEHLSVHRLTLARKLLMRTDESIIDVARRSGFNSREQFIRSFSKAFNWTPLQFRKAWSRAALSNSDLCQLCQFSQREPVTWQSLENPSGATPAPAAKKPQTLVVANALHQIVEIFSIDHGSERSRAGVLVRGAMKFIHQDAAGSQWLVRAPETGYERTFVTPNQHALAMITPEVMPG